MMDLGARWHSRQIDVEKGPVRARCTYQHHAGSVTNINKNVNVVYMYTCIHLYEHDEMDLSTSRWPLYAGRNLPSLIAYNPSPPSPKMEDEKA